MKLGFLIGNYIIINFLYYLLNIMEKIGFVEIICYENNWFYFLMEMEFNGKMLFVFIILYIYYFYKCLLFFKRVFCLFIIVIYDIFIFDL